jgi:dCMP deaminase
MSELFKMNKHEYICKITEVVAAKSTCDRANVGAVFISPDYEILSTGYNGAPKGLIHCDEVGHLLDKNGKCIRTTHAEQNAIIQAAKSGVSLKGSVLYVTHYPCQICQKMLINLGVIAIRYKVFYEPSHDFLKSTKIEVKTW